MNYYNEFDPYAAQWLRNLIAAGHIPQGEVDSRSIKDVKASELTGYTQCHFFAGIGGWSRALRLAGWPEDRPVWTGSCPCQPFSAAGAGGGVTDERHLWPTWFNLIRECRPPVIFGEQVEAAINHGWLDLVQANLEGEGYACGAVGIPAGGVGAPHIRQRLWFVADAQSVGRSVQHTPHDGSANAPSNTLANANDSVADQRRSDIGELGIAQSAGRRTGGGSLSEALKWAAGAPRPSGAQRGTNLTEQTQLIASWPTTSTRDYKGGYQGGAHEERQDQPRRIGCGGAANFWSDCDWLPCRDGKARPVEPGTFPLAHGVSGRVGRLRAYGNAIVPQVAQTFIEAYLES
jgi:DNA (cytosine-5)-methyltransferase 1